MNCPVCGKYHSKYPTKCESVASFGHGHHILLGPEAKKLSTYEQDEELYRAMQEYLKQFRKNNFVRRNMAKRRYRRNPPIPGSLESDILNRIIYAAYDESEHYLVFGDRKMGYREFTEWARSPGGSLLIKNEAKILLKDLFDTVIKDIDEFDFSMYP